MRFRWPFAWAVAVVWASLFSCARATAGGALKLDNYTFDKFLGISGFRFLVKFDQSYAYGEKEDHFKGLCKLAFSVPQFFIAEVPVQEYGDKENDDLRERFKLVKEDFPAYFFFDKDHPDGLRYQGSITSDALAVFLRNNNIKMPFEGTIPGLDDVVKNFASSNFDHKFVDDAKKLVQEQFSADPKAGWYVKIMQKIVEKGAGYVSAESARVSKLLEGKMAAEKSASLGDKAKILQVFARAHEEL